MKIDKIICLGKNYSEHAKEMNEALPEKPVLFIKPPSTLFYLQHSYEDSHQATLELAHEVAHEDTHKDKKEKQTKINIITLDDRDGDIQPELEVVIQLGPKGESISHWGLGLDMTKRTLQSQLKKKSHPWTIAKVFQHSSVLSPLWTYDKSQALNCGPFKLTINEKVVQEGFVTDMLLPIENCIEYCARYFPLCEGDLIYTGTPAGVTNIYKGDKSELIWGERKWLIQWN
jgi:2-keto-4-pentenoate hydratase/2-oxohepta-3-ene-1,7-dioic acid hydratase in catechol pathway